MNKRQGYDFERLDKFCKENNVNLLEDYSNVKLNGYFYIKSKCCYDKCDNFVNKTFRQLEKTGSYCVICIKIKANEVRKNSCLKKYGIESVIKKDEYKSKIISPKYNYDILKDFCLKNDIELLVDYKNVKLNACYYIEGKCQNKECENIFNKKMHKLINTNGMCNQCIRENAKVVRKNTNLKNIGCENYFQNESIKDKIKQYNQSKYGVQHVSQTEEYKKKLKETCLKKYGVPHFSHLKKVQDKITKTNLKKYGVEHLMKNPEYLENILKKAHKFKEYVLPSGKIIKIQGYEHYALDELIINDKMNESDIITGMTNIPLIKYYDINKQERNHYADIFIPSQNKFIEVKSTWTFQKPDVLVKQCAAKELGYNYEIWVYDKKANKICYD